MSTMKILADIEDLKQEVNTLRRRVEDVEKENERLRQAQEQKAKGHPRKDG